VIAVLIRALIFVVSAALGLIAADVILPGFHLHWNDWWGILVAVLVFAVLQSILAPLLTRFARRRATALLGGIGLISTLIALMIAVIIPAAGVGIDGPTAWIVGALIVWFVTAIATWLLTPLFLKDDGRKRERR